jgi:hypothetical protein
LIALVTLTDMQTSIAIGWMRASRANMKFNGFQVFLETFFEDFFSRNCIMAEPSAAQTR